MGRKNCTLSVLPASANIMTRLNKRFARSSGDIWLMSGGRTPPLLLANGTTGWPLAAGVPPERIATTATSAPSAAPASAHGRPARHPVAVAPPVATAAPHLWQKRAGEARGAPQAGQL